MKKYTKDTEDFIEAMLFAHAWEYSELNEEDVSLFDIKEEDVRSVEAFIESFWTYLCEEKEELSEQASELERSFGGNVFFSLSGHGCGFWDDSNSEIGDAMQNALERFAGNRYKFEGIKLVQDGEEVGILNVNW